jgi:hypothetical protein
VPIDRDSEAWRDGIWLDAERFVFLERFDAGDEDAWNVRLADVSGDSRILSTIPGREPPSLSANR